MTDSMLHTVDLSLKVGIPPTFLLYIDGYTSLATHSIPQMSSYEKKKTVFFCIYHCTCAYTYMTDSMLHTVDLSSKIGITLTLLLYRDGYTSSALHGIPQMSSYGKKKTDVFFDIYHCVYTNMTDSMPLTVDLSSKIGIPPTFLLYIDGCTRLDLYGIPQMSSYGKKKTVFFCIYHCVHVYTYMTDSMLQTVDLSSKIGIPPTLLLYIDGYTSSATHSIPQMSSYGKKKTVFFWYISLCVYVHE
jgi:hypothetical protein